MMQLTDILQSDCVKVPLDATGKQEAIYELVELLCTQCHIEEVDELKQAIWERELTRTTGIGHGIAIPHGKTLAVPQLCMAVGKPTKPIEFGAIDGQPVELIFLLASPLDQTGPHIQSLARISQMLTQEQIRSNIMTTTTADDVYSLIESNQPGS